MTLLLASSSPRRRQLLRLIGLQFEIEPSSVDEVARDGEAPADFALRAAREKALDVAARHPERLVLGSDTVVEIDGRILGKPSDQEDAVRMLSDLSGREHLVHTAVALAAKRECHDLVDSTRVRVLEVDEPTIRWYVATGEPMDKAGAYAIQGLAGLMVAGIDGSPHTVVGLPIHRLPELFAAHGVDMWSMLNGS